MATYSSCESSSAPIDFHLSSSTDDYTCRISTNYQKCPLCKKSRCKFYCRDCVRSGDFVRSTAPMVDRFSEMKIQLQRKKRLRTEVQESCEIILRKREKAEKLKNDIDACKDRINLLRKISSQCKENITKNRALARNLNEVNRQRSERLPKYQERVARLETIARQSNEKVDVHRNQLVAIQQKLKVVVLRRSEQLLKYIFPITEVIPPSRSEYSDGLEDSVTSAIAEASQMTFVRGQWVSSDCSGELHHCIVAPTLPISGDYSAYSMWVAANKDGVPGAGVSADKVELNPAYTISAALTYTAQLVNVLAFYLDVRLPRKQYYSDFCQHEMTDQQFARRVARLNANVLHLCFSQNISPSVLHPTRTLHNLLQLFNKDVSDLGRQGPVEVDTDLVRSLEEQLIRDLEAFDGDEEETCSDGEEEDYLPGEWESVPSLPYQESGAGALVGRSSTDGRALVSAQGSAVGTSVAGGLVTSAAASIASLWRGWTAGGNTNR
ncbi:beclin 1-associated autophagy-related key regulator [Neocloeon triangulifer]|uniref:beclin 1-associated autophagy-related key regulator n=1 Tax=Neocloeon triangulifer TaxID=2078957 RepID=UPI00286F1C98|nr:beclin 1-associated autophagy-related key regulator [Neocloeon triangulifer]